MGQYIPEQRLIPVFMDLKLTQSGIRKKKVLIKSETKVSIYLE